MDDKWFLEIDILSGKFRRKYFVHNRNSFRSVYRLCTESKHEVKIWLDLNGLKLGKMEETLGRTKGLYKIFRLEERT